MRLSRNDNPTTGLNESTQAKSFFQTECSLISRVAGVNQVEMTGMQL
jgi:hypothetical protein